MWVETFSKKKEVQRNSLSRADLASSKSVSEKFKRKKLELEDRKEVREILNNCENEKFDAVEFEKATKGEALIVLAHHLFEINKFYRIFQVTKNCAFAFFSKIKEGYKDNPYHNKTHAVDVTQVNFLYSLSQYS